MMETEVQEGLKVENSSICIEVSAKKIITIKIQLTRE